MSDIYEKYSVNLISRLAEGRIRLLEKREKRRKEIMRDAEREANKRRQQR